MRFFRILMTALWLLCGHGQAAETGLFWQLVSPAGKVSYLFGTIHTDDPRVTDFPPRVLQALNRVDTFMLEVAEPPRPEWLRLPQGDLSAYLSVTELDRFAALSERHAIPLEHALRMKPWLLAVLFDLPEPQTPFAQDFLLQATAETQGKRILGLEHPQAHFAVMDSLTMPEQLSMLHAVLKRSQAQKEQDFEDLLRTYLAGDSELIARMDASMTGDMLPPALWQRIRVKLLDERNVLMAARAIRQAQQERVFIAVGAAHLAGEHGLLHAFSQAGFMLTAIHE